MANCGWACVLDCVMSQSEKFGKVSSELSSSFSVYCARRTCWFKFLQIVFCWNGTFAKAMLKCKQSLVCLENESGFFSPFLFFCCSIQKEVTSYLKIFGETVLNEPSFVYKKRKNQTKTKNPPKKPGFRKFFGHLPAIGWPLDGTVVLRILLWSLTI